MADVYKIGVALNLGGNYKSELNAFSKMLGDTERAVDRVRLKMKTLGGPALIDEHAKIHGLQHAILNRTESRPSVRPNFVDEQSKQFLDPRRAEFS